MLDPSTAEVIASLSQMDTWDQIPLLGSESVENIPVNKRRVVRVRGMIQDQGDQEIYLAAYETKNSNSGEVHIRSGKYQGCADFMPDEHIVRDSPNNINEERFTYYCVPIPGENTWVTERITASYLSKIGSSPTLMCSKRSVEESGNSEAAVKRFRSEDGESNVKRAPEDMFCILKVYGRDSIPLNQLVECVGFIEYTSENGECATVHVLDLKRLTHCNPHLPSNLETSEAARRVHAEFDSIRRDLHALLTQSLLGDPVAANLLICHLMSRVYARNDTMALGKFCLNISGIPTGCRFARHLFSVVSQLVPVSNLLPLSLENMNRLQFSPKKDYESNRLKTGLLQMGEQSFLVLDEMALSTGRLQEQGVRNLADVGNLIRWQKVGYDFQYYQLDYTADIPVLILSEGKSVLPSDCHVPLRPAAGYEMPVGTSIPAPLATRLRDFLTVARSLEYRLPDDMQKLIQEDFVKSRQSDPSSLSADDLHMLLVLARLLSLSFGVQSLTPDLWQKTRMLHQEVKSRIPRTTRSSQ